jgi:pectin methylesterase-like acyl-CoA thioesterase
MKRLRGVAALLLLGWLLPPSLNAQQSPTLHVNRTDRTCGGLSPCFTTIQGAINAVGPGVVIHIQAGTYPEQLSITGKNNFQGASEVDRITIEADPATQPGQVVLTGAPVSSISSITSLYQQDAPPCPDCGAIMIRSGAC